MILFILIFNNFPYNFIDKNFIIIVYSLNLGLNTITLEGIKSLADALKFNSSLINLNLCNFNSNDFIRFKNNF